MKSFKHAKRYWPAHGQSYILTKRMTLPAAISALEPLHEQLLCYFCVDLGFHAYNTSSFSKI